MNWFDRGTLQYLKEGDEIIAELDGCKITKYVHMTIREGEGLGHIKRWRYRDDYED